ncbi:hypothetical protein TIFTF001_005148 [Ficus carica]|uniref:EF-hand domain-containing protein n=1 Tax=Ficus carica TaxID=3494 RepID=A0AA88CU98_FICCA|nr:hypothetical protein TIFTF001_005148 [Ficus carica]
MVRNIKYVAPNLKPKDTPVPLTNDQLAAIFRSYDADNDGQLSVDELKAAFEYLGSHFSYYRAIMARYKADKDKDGKINLSNDELSELVQYAHSCGYKVKACEVANKY